MFGLFGAVEEFIEDPLGTSLDLALSPLDNALEIIDGLTEGELRIRAAASLGADVAGGMAVSELIEWYND